MVTAIAGGRGSWMADNAVLTVAQMRAAEEAAMQNGVDEWELMLTAGRATAAWVARMAAGRSVTILCGPGNNGGDGYVIAETLRASGHDVKVVAPVDPKGEVAQKARAQFAGKPARTGRIDKAVVVDCLFGYGLDRAVEGPFADLLEEMDRSDSFRIAVDVPSAIASDSGEVLGPLPRYDLTLALGAWKRAHFMMPAMARMGETRLVPIGLDIGSTDCVLSRRPHFSAPEPDSHKYRRGLLAIVAGAMPGAPLLSSKAAMRSGAGYVKLLSDHSHPDAPAELVVADDPLDRALADERIDAILIGPGLGRDDTASRRLSAVLAAGRPTVLDADALHMLTPDLLGARAETTLIMTPHEGELSKLCNSFGVESANKLDTASRLAQTSDTVILAKGPDTVLASPDGRSMVFPRGSSWLSTAGTGDVLAGLVASRLAHHGDAVRAAEEGVWLHHEAARLAGPGFTAGDLADAVRTAVAQLS